MGTLQEICIQNQSDMYDVADVKNRRPIKRSETILKARIQNTLPSNIQKTEMGDYPIDEQVQPLL